MTYLESICLLKSGKGSVSMNVVCLRAVFFISYHIYVAAMDFVHLFQEWEWEHTSQDICVLEPKMEITKLFILYWTAVELRLRDSGLETILRMRL